MTQTRVKICGIKEPAHALLAAQCGAHWIGLVFVQASPRYVNLDQARSIIEKLPATCQAVGLFVNATANEIIDSCKYTGINCVQLHGQEPASLAEQIAPLRIIKAFPFNNSLEPAVAWTNQLSTEARQRVEAILIDTPPLNTTHPQMTGGSGQQFNWTNLKTELQLHNKWQQAIPHLMIAGGLDPTNVAQALIQSGANSADVSSGVEHTRGIKDPAKIQAFCQAALQSPLC